MAADGAGSLTGRVAFVTGGASGIGRAAALAFAREGAAVMIADIVKDSAAETARMVEESGGCALAVRCDVSRSEDVRSALDTAIEAFGRLDCAFNNAGVEEKVTTTADLAEDEWDRIINVNLRGTFLCMKYELPLMLRQGAGAIVNNSSVAGLVGFKGIPAYTAGKHGVIGLTRAAALEYAQSNIRINAVCPGVIDTEMVTRFTGGAAERRAELVAMEPIGRMGTPEEVAAAVVWLCSDAASFVTGHALAVDGGFVVP